jgi:hypothetical protein
VKNLKGVGVVSQRYQVRKSSQVLLNHFGKEGVSGNLETSSRLSDLLVCNCSLCSFIILSFLRALSPLWFDFSNMLLCLAQSGEGVVKFVILFRQPVFDFTDFPSSVFYLFLL